MNYAQIISIIGCLNLDWDEQLAQLFPYFKVSTGNLQHVISYECLLTGIFFKYIFLAKVNSLKKFQSQFFT